MKLPGKFHRAQQGSPESQLTSESHYKEALCVLTTEHVVQELKTLFSEQHLRALQCSSLVPSVMGQLKCNALEGHRAAPDRTLMHSPLRRIGSESSGNTEGKITELHPPLFPGVCALPKVLCILPLMKIKSENYENGQKCLKAFLRNTLTDQVPQLCLP